MESSSPELVMVFLWLGSRLTGLVFVALAVLLAYRGGQLSESARVRGLALRSPAYPTADHCGPGTRQAGSNHANSSPQQGGDA